MKERRSPVLTFVWTLIPLACSRQLLIASGSELVRMLVINRSVRIELSTSSLGLCSLGQRSYN